MSPTFAGTSGTVRLALFITFFVPCEKHREDMLGKSLGGTADYKSDGLSDAQTLRIVRAVKQGKRRWFGRRAEESNLIRVARTADYKAAPGTSQMPSGIL